MLNENFEFHFTEAPIVFKENPSASPNLIHKEALARAKHYLVAEADLLEIIIEIDKQHIYEKFGLSHLTPYCVKHLGLSEDVAANFVRVARKSQHVPELKVAIDQGRLSVTKAKAIASVITSENHSVWIDKAQHLTKEKLEKEVVGASPHAKKPEKAKMQGPDRIRVEFDLTQEEMQLFRRAQDLVSQKLGKSASLAETQMELLTLFLEKRDPVKKAQRAKKRLDNYKVLSEKQKSETPSIKNTFKNSQRSRDHFENKPARKNLKAEVIHAVSLRDKGLCQAVLPEGSICGESRWVHFHHIKPRSQGGEDSAQNLITLCSSHHRLWHSMGGKSLK